MQKRCYELLQEPVQTQPERVPLASDDASARHSVRPEVEQPSLAGRLVGCALE